MTQVSTIGLDLAKTVFQVHGVDASGAVTVRRALRRAPVLAWFAKLPPCLVGMEACATAHYRAPADQCVGHEVRLIPPAYAKAYVRPNKNDAAGAAAICEAVSRPAMRFVAVKSEAQQAASGSHKLRAAGQAADQGDQPAARPDGRVRYRGSQRAGRRRRAGGSPGRSGGCPHPSAAR
jgi:transposase